MTSENETVEAVLREIDEAHETWKRSEIANLPTQYLKEWHDRIESAWRREKAELRKCIEQAINGCTGCQDVGVCGSPLPFKGCKRKAEWRKVLEGAKDDSPSRKDH